MPRFNSLSDLRFGGRAPQVAGHGLNGFLHGAPLAAKLARTPVQNPQRIQNRAADAELRVTLELHLLGMVELVERVDQTHNPGRDQVVQLYILRQALMNPVSDITDGRKVLQQQPITLRALQPVEHWALLFI